MSIKSVIVGLFLDVYQAQSCLLLFVILAWGPQSGGQLVVARLRVSISDADSSARVPCRGLEHEILTLSSMRLLLLLLLRPSSYCRLDYMKEAFRFFFIAVVFVVIIVVAAALVRYFTDRSQRYWIY